MNTRRSTPSSPLRSKGKDTRERILAAAERLFSEHGIEGVSVRTVLAEAGVNVALAQRYFGGRDGLIEEVLRRAVGPLNERRLLLLEAVEARGDRSTLEDVLQALFAPSVRWLFEQPDRARLLAQLQTATDPKLRVLHRQYFDAPLQKFAEAMVRTVEPRLGQMEFVARFTFANGALNAFYRHGMDVARSARRLLGPAAVPNEQDWVDQIVAFCAAGLRAIVPPRAGAPLGLRGSPGSPPKTDKRSGRALNRVRGKPRSAPSMASQRNASKQKDRRG